ncbi:MAG: cell division protein ZapA [Bacteroidia bacterium]|nr:cell division protein ZapA [Bacteroidia bacterium]
MNDLIAISALIGDRTYRIKAEPSEEEVVRRRIKTINDKIVEFKSKFAGKDMQDYIAMVLIWFANEQTETVAADVEKEDLADQLNSIEKMLDGQLSSN